MVGVMMLVVAAGFAGMSTLDVVGSIMLVPAAVMGAMGFLMIWVGSVIRRRVATTLNAVIPGGLAGASELVAQAKMMMGAPAVPADGVPGAGVIVAVQPTNVLIGHQPVAAIELDVTVPGRAPFRATVQQPVPQVYLARLVPGTRLGIVVAADGRVVIKDWNGSPQ